MNVSGRRIQRSDRQARSRHVEPFKRLAQGAQRGQRGENRPPFGREGSEARSRQREASRPAAERLPEGYRRDGKRARTPEGGRAEASLRDDGRLHRACQPRPTARAMDEAAIRHRNYRAEAERLQAGARGLDAEQVRQGSGKLRCQARTGEQGHVASGIDPDAHAHAGGRRDRSSGVQARIGLRDVHEPGRRRAERPERQHGGASTARARNRRGHDLQRDRSRERDGGACQGRSDRGGHQGRGARHDDGSCRRRKHEPCRRCEHRSSSDGSVRPFGRPDGRGGERPCRSSSCFFRRRIRPHARLVAGFGAGEQRGMEHPGHNGGPRSLRGRRRNGKRRWNVSKNHAPAPRRSDRRGRIGDGIPRHQRPRRQRQHARRCRRRARAARQARRSFLRSKGRGDADAVRLGCEPRCPHHDEPRTRGDGEVHGGDERPDGRTTSR